MANKAYIYRLYPTKEQQELFAKTFGCCRFIWNAMLDDKIKTYQSTGKTLHNTPAQYKNQFEWLKEVDSLALANVQLHLQTAYQNFFRDKSVGFPKFKTKKRSQNSYTTNNQKGSVSVLENGIKLPKLGVVKAKIHRKAPDEWKLKSATITFHPDGSFYCSVLYEYENNILSTTVCLNKTIGLDYKSNGLYMDSNGNVADMPKYYRQSQKKLRKAQKLIARKKGSRKGELKSGNYKKQQQKINKIYRKITNQRKDYLHKLSNEITNHYDLICVEDLNMRAMANKGFKNGKATLDNSYGMFLNMLAYKQQDKGHHLVKVDKWYPSSQLCSDCGYQNPEVKNLAVNKWTCPVCKTVHNRDENAAINIKKEGYRLYLKEIEQAA